MSNYNSLIDLYPDNIEDSFKKNELAFLSLTTKVEHPLRDKIAWLLQTDFGDQKLIIREWTGWNKARHDLIIINNSNQELESIIEFKNHLSFTMKTKEYKNVLCADLLRSARSIQHKKEVITDKAEILFVMFGRTIDIKPDITDPKILQAMKYAKEAYKDCKKLPTQPIKHIDQFKKFIEDWERWLYIASIPKNKIKWLDPIRGGNFLGIGVNIITSIIGPFSEKEVFKLNTNYWHLP